MAAFSAVFFLMSGRTRGAGLLGGVLLGVGLVLPLGWLLSFHLSVRAEAKRLGLAQGQAAYTLLPAGAGEEALWRDIRRKLPGEKARDYRR